ncbi:hypothetical protein Cob_v003198 [Colletotrichum orbiculare MAFF 240422]|uniref:Uncharacterized protein n=1 Tax=Colletotrichum orbiculare (strain 104-T / ATCC 96160 / CBS 514.97 / LARS 414 / MAFF 240422) TaxID=1213857 RepID=A0A484G2J1_COLOR|nr:hypothetical protein Cob_v003198 [Colletotrichum orbiculare MAFF 240422]
MHLKLPDLVPPGFALLTWSYNEQRLHWSNRPARPLTGPHRSYFLIPILRFLRYTGSTTSLKAVTVLRSLNCVAVPNTHARRKLSNFQWSIRIFPSVNNSFIDTVWGRLLLKSTELPSRLF